MTEDTPQNPIMVDTKKGKVMVFRSLYFERKGKQYKLIGLQKNGKEYIHSVMNLKTREIREINDNDLQLWFK